MTNYITLPNGSLLFEGSVIQIKRFPHSKWTVNHGEYKWDNQTKEGWYLVSIGKRFICPLSENDLTDLVMIDFQNPTHDRYVPLQIISVENSDESEVHNA